MTRFLLRPFAAGFLSTLIFHQTVLAALWALGIVPRAPFNMTPVPPLSVPSVFSLAFFGGLWGILIVVCFRKIAMDQNLFRYLIAGATGPTAVALGVVLPLKGQPFNPLIIPLGLLLNAAWGLGLWLMMRYPQNDAVPPL
ncbi:MAG: hypothetical protein AB7F86_03590 [Bdellovibrionales bacterium]